MKKEKNEYLEILRALCCIMVVYVHSEAIYPYVNKLLGIELSTNLIVTLKMLSLCGVPIFFMISGYLSIGMRNKLYVENIKRKCRTLLKPFIVWNCFYLMFEMLGHFMLPVLFDNMLGLDALHFAAKLFGIPFSAPPIYGPLWFVRELFVLFLIYPVIIFVIEHLSDRVLMPLLLLVAVINIPYLYDNGYHLNMSLPFFMFGILKGEYLFNGIGGGGTTSRILGYLTVAVICLSYIYVRCDVNSIICSVFKIAIIILLFPIIFYTGKKITEKKGKLFELLMTIGRFSFMIYVLHGKPLTILQNICIRAIPQNNFILVAEYVFLPLLVIGGVIVFSIFLSKSMPKLYQFLTGGR